MIAPKSPRARSSDELSRWTFDRLRLFRIRNVPGAAREAAMSRQAAYALRPRFKGQPCDRAWAAAMAPRLRLLTGDGTPRHLMTGGDAFFA
jgi:hypothetical protein